jgi:hypothetical protein
MGARGVKKWLQLGASPQQRQKKSRLILTRSLGNRPRSDVANHDRSEFPAFSSFPQETNPKAKIENGIIRNDKHPLYTLSNFDLLQNSFRIRISHSLNFIHDGPWSI